MAASCRKTPVLESLFNSEYCKMFKSTYFEEHLQTTAALKICSWNWEKLRFIHNIRNFNFTLKNRFLKMIIFISLLVSHKVCIHIYFFREVRSKLQILTVPSVNQKKIKSSGKEYVMWTYFKFDQWKAFSGNYKPMRVWLIHSNSKEVSYLPWQNTYPNLKTTCHIKLNFIF